MTDHLPDATKKVGPDLDRIVWCRHHFKTDPLKDECTLGLEPRHGIPHNLLGGFYALPCHTRTSDGVEKRVCGQCSLFTAEEIAQQDVESAAFVKLATERLMATLPLVERIKQENRKRDATGVDACPICGKELHWSHAAYNGHVMVRCETEDCVRFME